MSANIILLVFAFPFLFCSVMKVKQILNDCLAQHLIILFFFPSSLSVFSAFVRAVGSGASSLHPPVVLTERGGQRGADQIVGGMS